MTTTKLTDTAIAILTDPMAAAINDLTRRLANGPELINLEDAALALNTTQRILADATRRGEIIVFRFGRQYQYPQSSLVAWAVTRMFGGTQIVEKIATPVNQTANEPGLAGPSNDWAAGRSNKANARDLSAE